jgi:hypothetical protein
MRLVAVLDPEKNDGMDEKSDEPDRLPPSPAGIPPSGHPLDRFCASILTDPALQAQLRSFDDAEEFITSVLQIARGREFQLDAEGVRAAMRIRPPGMEGPFAGEITETPLPPAGWLPVRTFWQRGELYLQWSYFGEQQLREPFFEGDVQHSLFKPFNRLFHPSTPITALADWLQVHPGLRPTGFIFHMSRCGSTLVSQMLASLDRSVVVSEASPIDSVVRARQVRLDLDENEHARWLAWMIGALGQPRRGNEQHYFIKLDCWHTLALPLFRRAFPDVPWAFLYRDPVEVLVSQLRMPGIQMIPGMLGAGLFGLDTSDDRGDRADYCARVLARICEPVLQHFSKDAALLVNYRELPQAVWTTIMPHFAVAASERDHAAMAETARLDAKSPSFAFAPDSEAKQRDATATTRAAADRQLGELYRQLEWMAAQSR